MDTTAKSTNYISIECQDLIHDYEIERTVLASLMTSFNNFHDVHDILTSECFYNLHYREIFDTILEIYRSGEMPDMMLVGNYLEKKNSGVTRLQVTELCVSSTIVFNLREHALLLKEFSIRRKLWEIGYKLMTQSVNQADDIEYIQNEAKMSIDSVFEESTSGVITMDDTYKSLQEELLVRMSMPEGCIMGTPTGFDLIDKNGGLSSSDLIVVGAETSQGKTSFATKLAMSAIENGHKVAFYSMEMTPRQLTARIASMRSGISSSQLLFRKISMEELLQVDKSMENIDMKLLHFDGKSHSSLDHIMMSIRNKKMKYDIHGVVVDYLQLVTLSDKSMTREQGVARIARDLKNLAKELDIWIIAISQLRRDGNNPIPSLSRLRDSGQIEEAADNIYLIYRPRDNASYPEPFTHIPTEGTALIKVAKGRHIGVSEFICGFKPENTLFYPLSLNDIDNLNKLMPLSTSNSHVIDNETPF